MKRFLPLLCLVALIALVFAMGWHRMLSLDMLRERRAMLVGFVMDRFMLAVMIYAALYVVVVALSLPGGAIMTVAGGFLFGKWLGTPMVAATTTIGVPSHLPKRNPPATVMIAPPGSDSATTTT